VKSTPIESNKRWRITALNVPVAMPGTGIVKAL